MHKVISFLLAVVLTVVIEAPLNAQIETVDKVAAIVNSDVITEFELERYFEPLKKRILSMNFSDAKKEETLKENRRNVLSKLIDQKLTDQEIEKSKIEVLDKDVDKAIDNLKASRSLSEDDFKQALKNEGLTLEEYRERVKQQIQRTKLVTLKVKSKTVITKDDIKAYYDSHPEKYKDETEYHIRNILLRKSANISQSDNDAAYSKMTNIVEELKNGESFGKLADQYSEAGISGSGGDLGWFKAESLSSVIRDALKGLKAGEYTEILDTDQGYQIFYLEEIRIKNKSTVEEAEKEIEKILFDEIVEKNYRTWLEELRTNSHIVIKE